MNKSWRRLINGFKQEGFAWTETTIVSVISIYVWTQSGSLAPTNSEPYFFWPLFGPLLIALRYGFAKGISCALLMCAGLASIMSISGYLNYYPFPLAVGTILTAMIAGEFRDYWHNINQKHILDHQYMTQRLDSFTEHYHLLKVSHDQLEQRTAGQTVSLRSSINELQKLATQHSDHRIEHLGQPFLNLFAEIVGIEVAGIYRITNGELVPHAHAVLGDDHQLITDDPMLLDMLECKKLLSPAQLESGQEHKSRYQLCIPLLDTHKKLQAIVVAERTKFFMLTPSNIALLSLVANHSADLLSDAIIAPVLNKHQSDLFLRYIERAEYNKHHYGADSTLVACIDRSGLNKQTLDSIIDYRRGADVYWSCQTRDGHPALAVLLPLTTVYDAQQYVKRLQELLQKQLHKNHDEIDILGPLSLDKRRQEIRLIMDELGAFDEEMAMYSDDSI
ncbi:Extracellular Matrix protein PelD [Photobacterium marinum]|uniref:Extracellular Matrix protein PelD n=2 Tax=Photobacterium marinum TaxID=1056511 RepID=L8JA88_9GAMM|nr:Extracellular Matrix protein PelD [Photobacterium marinum]